MKSTSPIDIPRNPLKVNMIKSFLGDTMLPSLDGYTKLPKIVSPDAKNSNKEQNTNGVLISTHSFPKIFKMQS